MQILRLEWLKIDGCMHPLLKIDGCSCTLCTRSNQGPATSYLYRALQKSSNVEKVFTDNQGPGQNGCDGCSCTRQFWTTGACTHRFSDFIHVIFIFMAKTFPSCIVFPTNCQNCTCQLKFLTRSLQCKTFLKPGRQSGILTYMTGRQIGYAIGN